MGFAAEQVRDVHTILAKSSAEGFEGTLQSRNCLDIRSGYGKGWKRSVERNKG